jgi:hypothetical protein
MQKGLLSLPRLMATQTTFRVFTRTGTKRKDQFVRGKGLGLVAARSLLTFDVGLSWTMTGLAGHTRLGLGFEMRVSGLAELRDFGTMTGTAGVVADKVRRRRSLTYSLQRDRWPYCRFRQALRPDDLGARNDSNDCN